ncbi:MAG: aminotransferase class I/II-fold pyridoxal phosphate-dependent enzyme, partial [Nakamurella sp.]
MVETGGRNGTRVSRRPPLTARSSTPPVESGVADLADGQPDPELLPALDLTSSPIAGGSAAVPADYLLPELMTLSRKRFGADDVPTDSMTIASGGLDAIRQVLSAQLRPGDAVAIEDPGWPNALDLIATLGLR